MRDPRSLYELNPDVIVPAGLPLVAGLTGYADAGGAVGQTTEYLLSTLDSTVVASFEADELLDSGGVHAGGAGRRGRGAPSDPRHASGRAGESAADPCHRQRH